MSIEATAIGFRIADHQILHEVTVTCVPGQVLALTGPSGSGKSTLLSILGLLQRPGSGSLSVDGRDANRWGDRARQRFWRDQAAFIYQDYGVIDEDTVTENITLHPRRRWARTRPDPRVDEILAAVGLEGRESDPVSVLSGGEKQRVGVARALYKKATYVFADEPTASLDTDNRRTVTGLLARLAHERGACVVLATHDEDLAASADAACQL